MTLAFSSQESSICLSLQFSERSFSKALLCSRYYPNFYPIRFFTSTFQTTIANQVLQFLYHFTFGFLI